MKSCKFLQSIATLLLASLAGCAGLNDCCYENSQKARAVRQYIECGNAECEKFPHDYKLGWIDGFYNASTGGPACPPAVAPQRYWNPKQILDQCDNRRHSYYSGWQDGASRASQFPDTHHLKIFETCECPMPRCESSCGPGGCVPCGLGSLGSPVHAELIEAPHPAASFTPVPFIPTAPIADSVEEEVADEAIGDGETTSVTPNDSGKSIAAKTVSVIRGNARVQNLDAETIDATNASVRLVENDIVPQASETKSDKPVAMSGNVDDVLKQASGSPSEVTLKSQEKAKAKTTRHPAVAKVTIPVRFEMIESDGAPVVQAK